MQRNASSQKSSLETRNSDEVRGGNPAYILKLLKFITDRRVTWICFLISLSQYLKQKRTRHDEGLICCEDKSANGRGQELGIVGMR